MISNVSIVDMPGFGGRSAVAIGVFDGVHVGHRRLLGILRDEAKRSGGQSVVLTFERHPSELVAPAHAPMYINTLEQRVRYLEEAGADVVIVVRFDREFAGLEPEEFIRDVLVNKLGAGAVVVGPNFMFGKNRSGNVNTLQELGSKYALSVLVVPPLLVGGEFVSSTRVRGLIAEGDISTAAELLGRNFTLVGTIVHGERIGHRIGFPTANVAVEEKQIVPANGVYAAAFTVQGKRHELSVVSVGTRPTIGGRPRSIEVHIPGFKGNIYGETVEVEFKRRLRSEQKFDSLEALADQISKDIEAARLCCLMPPTPDDYSEQT